jgi:hypothetical protein
MSKRNRNRGTVVLPQSLTAVDEQIQKLSIHKSLLYERLMESNKSEDIMKALAYQQKFTAGNTDQQKAFLFAPDNEFYTGLGYKPAIKVVPFDFLRAMGSSPMIFSVISTRINQILEFSNFSTELDRPGWTIRRKTSRFATEYKNSDKDKQAIEKIVDFLENGGISAKFTLHDDLHDFLKVFPRDLLELDQGCFELQRNRAGELLTFNTVDSATIRLMETIDPNYRDIDKYQEVDFKDAKYFPSYCQVWRERVLKNPKTQEDIIWYPWEMCFATRNKQSAIMANGYGQSELEVLMRVVTWFLESMEYNGRFFTNGSNPRGFFTVKGGVDPRMLNDFRMAWRSMVTGWQNAHKVPIFEADKIDWVSMQNTNKEMEFAKWMEFLTLVTCAVYKVDSGELGFKFSQQNSMFGESGSGQKQRQDHSKDKGLKPLLKVIQKNIDKFIVSELDSNYEFIWTGIDVEDETIILDNDIKKVNAGFVAMQDKFKEYSGRAFNEEKDIILNSVYLQQKMQQQFGGQGMNSAVDQEMGGADQGAKNPFDDFTNDVQKGNSSDPFNKQLIEYINRELVTK